MINRLELRNFTVFKNLDLDFSAKINIIIGENGTGKTHLLKAAYGLCSGNAPLLGVSNASKDLVQDLLSAKLLGLFMPLDNRLGELHHRDATDRARLQGHFTFERSVAASFDRASETLTVDSQVEYERYSWEPVFIPTKEVLSFMKGFTSLYDRREISFDETYRDICAKLDLPKIRQGALSESSKLVLERLEEICGGRFFFHGSGNVTFSSRDNVYSANSIAEGFRKLGMLSRLIEIGAVYPGGTGPLFWDEPESNMNPTLMKALVEILLELARSGQHIILATHEYTLLKWFDLLRDKDTKDQVRFHALYRDRDSKEIGVHSTDNYLELEPNAIADTFTDLTIAQINAHRGVLQDA